MAPNLQLVHTGGVVNGNGNNKKKRRRLIIWGSVGLVLVLLIAAGVIAAKGLVNSREHFESLIIAKETGFASIQSYLRAQPELVE